MGIFDEVAKSYRRGGALMRKAKRTPPGRAAVQEAGEDAAQAQEAAPSARMGSYSKYPAPAAAPPIKPMPVRKVGPRGGQSEE